MPHTRSARKNLRKADKRRIHNKATVRTIKTYLKRADAAEAGPVEKLREESTTAIKKIDKAAARRVIHPNKAARLKSRLMRKLHAKQKEGQAAPSQS
jgi:small subunit ribosomal protein S20